MWDPGSTVCLITFQKADEMKLKGLPVRLEVGKVGGERELLNSYKYNMTLYDTQGRAIPIEVLGINQISSEIASIDIHSIEKLLPRVPNGGLQRPSSGYIDCLIGYNYAGFHPTKVSATEHLLLLENIFGFVVGGRHPSIKENTKPIVQQVDVFKVEAKIDDFFRMESLGVECTPRCGGCKCGTCHPGGKEMTLQEEEDSKIIDRNLKYDPHKRKWIAGYPWVKDPQDLPNNESFAFSRLISTEKRLSKNPATAFLYSQAILDMVYRGAARKLSDSELKEYNGPVFYIAHHAVLNPNSASTPCRIVFNSSAKFKGHCLNDYYAKGPDSLNNLLGILLRFREERTALVGDISKMYHSIAIPELDQMTHRFLWRDLKTNRRPDTYVMTAINMGDKPSGSMAISVLKKTAEMKSDVFPQSSKIIIENSYMDDIIDSVATPEVATKATKEIDEMLALGGFRVKRWFVSGSTLHSNAENIESKSLHLHKTGTYSDAHQRVLGMKWESDVDNIVFESSCDTFQSNKTAGDFSNLHDISSTLKLTKRFILSRVNSLYDPLGLLAPFTVRAKILLRQLWTLQDPPLDWDDPIPTQLHDDWLRFFAELTNVSDLKFRRCLKPIGAVGSPTLVIFSDGSGVAYGAVCYVRWKLENGSFQSTLICSKNRLAPIKIIDTVRLELLGAVISTRLRSFVDKHMRYKFERTYHIVDSEIVKAMINKGSYGFNTFAANRVGEIQTHTSASEWFWAPGKLNISDWITRGKDVKDLDSDSIWQNGPEFLKLDEHDWPIKCQTNVNQLPEIPSTVSIALAKIEDTLAIRLNIGRFSSLDKLLRVTARVLKIYWRFKGNRPKATNLSQITPSDMKAAHRFWVLEAQRSLHDKAMQKSLSKLCPKMENEVIVASGRAGRWMEATWNKQAYILLPSDHPLSKLIADHEHKKAGHCGVAATIAQIRAKYWVLGIRRIVKKIVGTCVQCRIKLKRTESQVMGDLPISRLKPCPPFSSTGVDYFGPFIIKGEVQKRTRGKCFGVIFACLTSRAVHIDLSPNYSTDGFLQVLRRFSSVRGWPSKMFSDQGSQLVAASKELKAAVEGLDQQIIREYGVKNSCDWSFCPADAPWQNGATEILIKTAKRSLYTAIGTQVLSFSELQTVFSEVSQIMNQRPIGACPVNPDDGTYLSPNDLLLGRSTSQIPQGPFLERASYRHRFDFVQSIVERFWRKWSRDVFPQLLIRQKWHVQKRNVKEGDVVLVQDNNAVRGHWQMAVVKQTFPGNDGRVRNVKVGYKNFPDNEPANVYGGKRFTLVDRPVHRLIVLLAADEEDPLEGGV